MILENNSSMITLDSIDLQILDILRSNGKAGIKEIASQIGLTVSPTFERIKRMERGGVILSYTINVLKKAIGKNLQVFCQVSLKEHNAELIAVFEEQVVGLPEVTACYHVAGNQDYILLIEVDDMNEYETFLKHKLATIPDISNVQSSFVMSALKE